MFGVKVPNIRVNQISPGPGLESRSSLYQVILGGYFIFEVNFVHSLFVIFVAVI